MDMRVGVIGYGYWGPNLVRNFAESPHFEVAMVSDLDENKRKRVKMRHPNVKTTARADELIKATDIDLVAIATPVHTHFELAMAALKAGKHVFVEKPITTNAEEAMRLIDEADKRGTILAVDHTFLFTGAVRKLKELVAKKALGNVYYYDSVRVNLGLFQSDVSVVCDLAVHDFAITDYLFNEQPEIVSASGSSHIPGSQRNVAYITVQHASGLISHVNVNWLAPVKIRQTLIGGAEKMVVYDDMEPSEKIKIYDHGVTLSAQPQTEEEILQMRIGYRKGDVLSPKLDTREALAVELDHLADCLANNRTPINDGKLGARVVQMMEAAEKSMCSNGAPIHLKALV